MSKYEIKKDGQRYKLIDRATKKETVPDCGQDLVAYHAYLSFKSKVLAEQLLDEVAEGKRPISELIANVRERVMTHTGNY